MPGRGRGAWSRVQIVGFLPPSFDFRVQIRPFCPRRSSHCSSRGRIVVFCPRGWIHVCRSGPSAPVVLHIELHGCRLRVFAPVVLLIELHGCRLRVFAPVGFNECCPELRQGPAQLRVLRNSPRAMPLFGLPIIVMTALYTSRKQVKLQRACV